MHDNADSVKSDAPDTQRMAAAHRAAGQVDLGLKPRPDGLPDIQIAHVVAYAEIFLLHYLAMKPKLWTPGGE